MIPTSDRTTVKVPGLLAASAVGTTRHVVVLEFVAGVLAIQSLVGRRGQTNTRRLSHEVGKVTNTLSGQTLLLILLAHV